MANEMEKQCLFKFTPNLQRMATVSLAVSLWEQKHIKSKMKSIFRRNRGSLCAKYKYKWRALTKEVTESVANIPDILLSQIVLVVRSIGEKLYNWYAHMGSKEIDDAEVIYWTHYGCIDEFRLFRKFSQRSICNVNLNQFWSHYHQISCFKTNGSYVYFKQRFLNNNIHKKLPTPRMNMLKSLAKQGNYVAVKHFWNTMDDFERSEIAETGLCGIVDVITINDYRSEKFIELGMFLINAMTDSQRDQFLKRHGVSFLFSMWLCHWPWIELFVPTLVSMWQQINEPTYHMIINQIITAMRNDFYLGYAVEDTVHQRILQQIWVNSPTDLKRSIPYSLIAILISIFDYSSFKLITNDTVMKERKLNEEYLAFIGAIKEANKIVQVQIIDDFKNKMNLIEILLNNCLYKTADLLLDWDSCSEQEKRYYENFEPVFLHGYFVSMNKYSLADKVLEWRFTIRNN